MVTLQILSSDDEPHMAAAIVFLATDKNQVTGSLSQMKPAGKEAEGRSLREYSGRKISFSRRTQPAGLPLSIPHEKLPGLAGLRHPHTFTA
ncbi:hypothetical protein [Rhizobium sp. LCM 4573]|uniref:hypothetical protein n=1 Tax=Rhizobium sp. LCM 4573 TaxID=1848291 RepID=UPI0010422137|nr:hypothetical protein [Rhizobium sp. LCM 4573]